MNEEPTIPFGVPQVDRAEAPSALSTWGDFSLLARVGSGGFGEVYRAWDPQLQREVALKLLLPGAVGGEAEYSAMLREARALASVRHTNIVPVHGIDRQDGRVGFWTDFVHGKTLAALLHEQGTFGAREAALICLDVAKALSAVHRAGLLHRDIKAENVMREEGGRILLMDFGLSSLERRQTDTAGTPNYMAPELFRGGPATVATDIYAMGVLLYYLVSGEFPAKLIGLPVTEALTKLARRKPLVDLRHDLPDSLLRTVSTAMEMEPEKRFASAGELAAALAESLGAAPRAEAPASAHPEISKARRRVKILAAVAVAAGLVAGGVAIWQSALLQRIGLAKIPAAASGTTYDRYLKAQDLLLHSYKNANIEEAVAGFQAVLKADPGFALAEARLGAAYFIQYRNSQNPALLNLATEATNRAMQLNGNLAPPYVTLSRIAAMQGNTALAMTQAEKALSLEPRSAEAHGAMAEVYAAQGKDGDAGAEYRKAIDLAPEDWRWPVRLGQKELDAGHAEEAIAEFKRAVELAPDNAVAFHNLGIANMRSGQIDEARKNLENSLSIEPDEDTYSALGTVFLLAGNYDQAAERYRKAIDLNSNDYAAWGDLAVAYKWSGTHSDRASAAFQKAIVLGEQARTKDNNDPDLLVALADYYASVGIPEKSNILLRQAIALAPENRSVEYEAGETYEALGKRREAIPLIAKALASGYDAYEFQHNPDLAALRGDPAFAASLSAAKRTKQ